MGNIYAGRTIELPKTSGGIPHLWIVVTDPEGNPPEVVIVNLTTRQIDSDTTVVLNVGDHRYIRHETVVFYADARFAKTAGIEAISRFPGYGYHDDCSAKLLSTVRQGLLDSADTPKKIKEYCKVRFPPASGSAP
jgi:hypothetical protein